VSCIFSNKTDNVRINGIWRCVRATNFFRGNSISITYSECVCCLSYTACKAHAPWYHLWPVRLYHIFPLYVINVAIFVKKLLIIKCAFWFSPQFFFWDICHSNENLAKYMYIDLRAKYPLFLSYFNKTCIFCTDFGKNTQIRNLMKIRPVGAEIFYADGRTDMRKLIVAFRSLAKSPKKRRNFITS
jgi:hypothetical protein